jgi:adenine-specific DNA-methyltransferase
MAEKLEMMSGDIIKENIDYIASKFPNALKEVMENGKLVKKIDFDVLKQELSNVVIDDKQERYQMTWPDKKKSILLANSRINGTLRPVKEKSVDFDNTKNLYIEGDNLDVLKLLRETYLGKVKMIYIDPPYNTGNDFVYEDNFHESADEYLIESQQFDEQGNRMFTNSESNGRFHTDWLNHIYPRLVVAKDLLTDKGICLIHIDENEDFNLRLICREIFGPQNELGSIVWDKRNPKGDIVGVAYQHETVLAFAKNKNNLVNLDFIKRKENAEEIIEKSKSLMRKHKGVNENSRGEFRAWMAENKKIFTGGELAYNLIDDNGDVYRMVSMAAPDKPETRSHRPLIHPITGKPCPTPAKGWRYKDSTLDSMIKNNQIVFGVDEKTQPNSKYLLKDNMEEMVSSLIYFGGSDDALGLPFDNPKPVYIAKKLISAVCKHKDDIVIDFYGGSSTTAQAIFELNYEDGLNRKFILIQIPELCAEKSLAFKQGFKYITEIGEERIRRAGKKIHEEAGIISSNIDIGFRVFELDSSNMEDVYYSPKSYNQNLLEELVGNVKEDRTPLDLLFQVMLELGIELSAKIEEKVISGKQCFVVNNNDIVACFDNGITDEVIKELAKAHSIYAVFKDSAFANDSSNINCEQIFKSISPSTTIKVI